VYGSTGALDITMYITDIKFLKELVKEKHSYMDCGSIWLWYSIGFGSGCACSLI